jgi:hypothetical protein
VQAGAGLQMSIAIKCKRLAFVLKAGKNSTLFINLGRK